MRDILRDGGALLIALTVIVCGILLMVSVLIHLHISLVDAVNELHTCEQSGGIDCHIEQDGLNYNVYSRGELECQIECQ